MKLSSIITTVNAPPLVSVNPYAFSPAAHTISQIPAAKRKIQAMVADHTARCELVWFARQGDKVATNFRVVSPASGMSRAGDSPLL
jgi:hypothetical protein